MTKPMILLLGNYRPSLTIARTFHEKGFKVAVGTHGCERLCQHSKAVSMMWAHSSLDRGANVLANEIKEFHNSHPELIAIFPVAEEYVRLVANNEELFSELPKIVTMDSDLIKTCLDKEKLLNIAKDVDVPSAPFTHTRGLQEALNAGECITGYPMIIRPADSTKRIAGNKAVTVFSEEELLEFFSELKNENQELLVQRLFEGKRHNVYFAAIDGRPTRLLHAVINRTDKLDDTGLAVEGVTLRTDHELVSQTERVLSKLNYTGIGCAQFLVNENSGRASFLEINPRIAGNHALPEFAGLNLAWFNYERVVKNKTIKKKVLAKDGIKYSWLGGDLMGAKVAYLRGEISASELLKWTTKAVITAIQSDLCIDFSKRDLKPGIRGILNVLPRLARWKKREINPGENTIYANEQRRAS